MGKKNNISGGGSTVKSKDIVIPETTWRTAMRQSVPISDVVPGAMTHYELRQKFHISQSSVCKAKSSGALVVVGHRYSLSGNGSIRTTALLMPAKEAKARKLKILPDLSRRKNEIA